MTTLAAAERAVAAIVRAGQIGGWRLTEQLGGGGYGSTWLATKKGLDGSLRKAVVKLTQPAVIVSREERDGTDGQQSFLQEFAALQQLRSPHIAEIYDGGLEEVQGVDVPWLALERIEGSNLSDDLLHGPLTEHRWLTLARDLFEALDVVHTAGLVHLDVKPANIMLRPRGAVLIDFGIAERRDVAPVQVGGTAGFFAPEQIDSTLDAADAAPAVDMFKAGVTLVHAALRRNPWPSLDVKAGFEEQAAVLATAPDLTGLTVTQRSLVAPLLALDPATRPSAAAMQDLAAAALGGVVSGPLTPAPATPDPEQDLPTVVRTDPAPSVQLGPRPSHFAPRPQLPPPTSAPRPGAAPGVVAPAAASAASFVPPAAAQHPAVVPASAPSFAAPSYTPPTFAQQGSYAPAPRPRASTADLVWTIVLMLVGALAVIGALLLAALYDSPIMVEVMAEDGIYGYDPGGWPVFLSISHLLLYGGVIPAVIFRRRAGGSTFWIPLAAGAVATVCFFAAVVGMSSAMGPI